MDNIKIENRTIEDFFDVLNFFKNAKYNQKIAFMKKYWGDICYTTKIIYANDCSITININSENKYTFDFDCPEILFSKFEYYLPEYANAFINLGHDTMLKNYSEISELRVISTENKSSETLESANENIQDICDIKLDSNYLNIYRGINLSNNKKNS